MIPLQWFVDIAGFVNRARLIGGIKFSIKSCFGLSEERGEVDHSTGEKGIIEWTYDSIRKELS